MRGRLGFSAVELMIAMAIIGILVGLGAVLVRRPAVRVLSNEFRMQIVQARFEAVERNRPVAVTWDGETRTLSTRVNLDDPLVGAACDGQAIRSHAGSSAYRDVTISGTFASIVFLPNGQARKCDGSAIGASDSTLQISDSRRTVTIAVTSAGRIVVQ